MTFELRWTREAQETFTTLQTAAQKALEHRRASANPKSSRAEGLFKQVVKCVELLRANPRHTGLHTHEFSSMKNPFDAGQKVFEAYVQNNTPGAYRLFWCYGPGARQITIIAITPHP